MQPKHSEFAKKIFLGLMMGATAFALIYWFGYKQLKQGTSELKKEKMSLKKERRRNTQLLQKSEEIRDNLRQNRKKLKKILAKQLPGADDASEWLRGRINPLEKRTGVKVQSVDAGGTRGISNNEKKPSPLELLFANLQIKGQYHSFGHFLAEFEKMFPYSQAQKLTINGNLEYQEAKDREPLTITMQYGFFRFTEEGFKEKKKKTLLDFSEAESSGQKDSQQ